MIDVEEQLRHEMRTEAERVQRESIRPLRVPAPSRISKTARWLAPVAAAAAVAGLIAGVTIAGHSTVKVPNTHTLPAGAPKYYITLDSFALGTTKYVVEAVVRSSADGAAISSLQLLRSRLIPQPLAITAAANDRAFLITLPGSLEILHLAADGHVRGLTRLPKIHALDELNGAVLSPDGTEVVVPIGPPAQCKSCAHGIAMYSVNTGMTRKWLQPSGDEDVWRPVTWPGRGHEVFLSDAFGTYRLLDVARPAGSLFATSRRIHKPNLLPAEVLKQGGPIFESFSWLMPGDKALFTAYSRLSTARHGGSKQRIQTARIFETSASTGRLLRMLATFSARVSSRSVGCFPMSVGPSGVHVLMWCNFAFGRLDGRHFTPLPGMPYLNSNEGAAW